MARDTIGVVKRAAKTGASIGDRCRIAREARGLGVNELNRLLELSDGTDASKGYVSKLESGERVKIPAKYATALARALCVRAEWLVDGIEPMQYQSGEVPALLTAARMDKPNLEKVIDAQNVRGRWSEATEAAARALPSDRPLDEWPELLDSIQGAIAPILRNLPRRSRE